MVGRLVLFILKKTFHEGIAKYKSIMAQNIPYSEKAKEMIQMKLEQTKDISQEMLKDLMQGSIPEVAELMERMKQKNYKLLLDDMIAAQNKGEIRKDILQMISQHSQPSEHSLSSPCVVLLYVNHRLRNILSGPNLVETAQIQI